MMNCVIEIFMVLSRIAIVLEKSIENIPEE